MRVEIQGLGFAYAGRDGSITTALRNLDLTIESGTVHAVVGPNGCGKSTLLRIVNGMEEPATGTVEFVGRQVRQHATALVFQDPTLLPWWDVGRNIALSAEARGVDGKLYDRVKDFHTRQVGLHALRNRRPHTLSFGQQTRTGIGRALAHDSDVLLLDEPFVHLDAITRRRMHREMETHWQLEPVTTVIVTHDVDEAVLLADHVSVMSPRPGRVIETVTVDAARPRVSLPPTEPGLRAATAHVWAALERAGGAA